MSKRWRLVVAGLLAGLTTARVAGAQDSKSKKGATEAGDTQPPDQQHRDASSSSAGTSGRNSHSRRPDSKASYPVRPIDIVVMGRRRPSLGTTVTVRGRKQLDSIGATNVAEAIESVPSATTSRNERGESVVSLRGFGQRQILVLMDGVPAAVPYDGRLDLAKVPSDLVQRVVVVKGAGSLLYGPNGLGGVINIVTRRPGSGPRWTMRTEIEPVRSVTQSMTASARQGNVGTLLGLTLGERSSYPLAAGFPSTPNEDGGEREASDGRRIQGLAKVAWDITPAHRVQALVSTVRGTFGVPPGAYDVAPRYWRWSRWDATTLSVSHRWSAKRARLGEVVYLSLAGNTLDAYDDKTYTSQRSSGAFTSSYTDSSAGAYLQGKLPVFRYRSGSSLDLYGWLGGQHDRHHAEGLGPGAVDASSNLLTASAQAQWRLSEPWLVVPGVQADVQLPEQGPDGTKPDSAWSVGPMLSVSRALGKSIWLSGTTAMRSRFPTLRERYSEVFGSRLANPGLRAERSINSAVDVTWRPRRGMRLMLGAFNASVSDLVVLVPVRAGTEQLQNVGQATFRGIEAEGKVRLKGLGEVFAGWTWLSARRTSGGEGDEPGVPYRPKHKGTLGVTVEPIAWMSLTLMERLVGPQWFQNPNTLAWGKLGWSERLDARLQVKMHEQVSLWVRGTNLLDSNVWSRYGYPDPGRQLFVGVRVQGRR